jgi:murein DD-endopeptidase MepM/ murein hydrolase activator NlpD
MPTVAIAARVLAARNLRRLLGCGCVTGTCIVVLPLFMLFSMAGGMPVLGGGGTNQVDGSAAGGAVIIGTAEPLAPGGFSVSQGFGCTTVTSEPAPPPGYACPPDATHAAAIHFHSGIDLAAMAATPVYAVVAGSVRVVESAGGFGLHLLLTASAATVPTVAYLYGHLGGAAVADGAVVRTGEPIGFVGSTGNSTGPHLHFEVDVGGTPVNPCSTFPPGYLAPPGVAAAGCLAWAT